MAYGWEETKMSVVALIKYATEHATHESASFMCINHDDKYPTNESEVNDFIKNRIKLYNDTWVVSPLKEALRRLRGE